MHSVRCAQTPEPDVQTLPKQAGSGSRTPGAAGLGESFNLCNAAGRKRKRTSSAAAVLK